MHPPEPVINLAVLDDDHLGFEAATLRGLMGGIRLFDEPVPFSEASLSENQNQQNRRID